MQAVEEELDQQPLVLVVMVAEEMELAPVPEMEIMEQPALVAAEEDLNSTKDLVLVAQVDPGDLG